MCKEHLHFIIYQGVKLLCLEIFNIVTRTLGPLGAHNDLMTEFC